MPYEYTVRWSGARIGSGASVFHFRPAGGATGAATIGTATRTFFEAVKGLLPSAVTLSYDREVRQLANDGTLEAVFPVAQQNVTVGTGSAYVNGAGGCIRWTTDVVSGGRRQQGRTFLVPMSTAAFQAGEVSSASIGTVGTAAAAYITSLDSGGVDLLVWSRKNGTTADVIAGALLSRPSSLRTRNDRD